MNRVVRTSALLAAFALGCVATSTIVSSSQASAEVAGGTTCRAWYLEPPRIREPALEGGAVRTVEVPPGWNPVGGGGNDGGVYVIACKQH